MPRAAVSGSPRPSWTLSSRRRASPFQQTRCPHPLAIDGIQGPRCAHSTLCHRWQSLDRHRCGGPAMSDRSILRDVADGAGVSLRTASRVLNDDPRVAEATRERVRAVMSELNYTPDLMARSLRGGIDATIGLVVESIADPFFSELVASVETAASERGQVGPRRVDERRAGARGEARVGADAASSVRPAPRAHGERPLVARGRTDPLRPGRPWRRRDRGGRCRHRRLVDEL